MKCIEDIYTSYKCKQLWIKSDETLRYYLELAGEVESFSDSLYKRIVFFLENVIIVTEDDNEEVNEDVTECNEPEDETVEVKPEVENDTNETKPKTKRIKPLNKKTNKSKIPYCQRCYIYFAVSIRTYVNRSPTIMIFFLDLERLFRS